MQRTTQELSIEDGGGGRIDYVVTNGILPEDIVDVLVAAWMYEKAQGEEPPVRVSRDIISYLVHGV